MHRISIVIALSAFLLVSVTSAQQAKSPQTANPTVTPTQGTVINCVNAQAGRIPVFTATAPPNVQICNSGIYEAAPYGTGPIGILNPNPVAALDVAGDINTSQYYQIGGSTVLSVSGSGSNLFVGEGAGSSNTGGFYNTFAGTGAGYSTTVSSVDTFIGYYAGHYTNGGNQNTFVGSYAGYANTTGGSNTLIGPSAGFSSTTGTENAFVGGASGYYNTTGSLNVFIGQQAGFYNTTGYANTFTGALAGWENTTGTYNTLTGLQAGQSITTGNQNTFTGSNAGPYTSTGNGNAFTGYGVGWSNTTGAYNTFEGYYAGYNNLSGNNDIYIGNKGPSSGAESSTIRIGGDIGTGFGPQTAAYIVGIYGSTASGGVPVYINSNGQLGTSSSSLRFKEHVRDMGDSTNALMKLRPVTFLYKPEFADGERSQQYGLIAEEVAQVYPELVAYDNDGRPYSVRYQYLSTMLLNEVQKQYHRADAEAELIKTQEERINELEERLSRLEKLAESQPQSIAMK